MAFGPRLIKNFKHRQKVMVQKNIEAYRLYDRDIPEYPYIIDLYKDNVIVYDRRDERIDGEKESHHIEVMESLDLFCEENKFTLITKKRVSSVGGEKYGKFDSTSQELLIHEGPLKLLVNLHDYVDTGLFLDHRPLRSWLLKDSKGKRCLNLFSYTASLSMAMAKGEAQSVRSVDLSKTYTNWAIKHSKLNGVDNICDFVESDVMEYLGEAILRKESYDLIVIDPPTFSNSKKTETIFDVNKDYVKLLEMCFELLSPKGTLYFSTNSRSFKLDERYKNLPDLKFQEKTKESIPMDFHDQKIHKLYRWIAS